MKKDECSGPNADVSYLKPCVINLECASVDPTHLYVATRLKSSKHEHESEAQDDDVQQPLPLWTHFAGFTQIPRGSDYKKKSTGENSTSESGRREVETRRVCDIRATTQKNN